MENTIFHIDVNSAFLSWEACYRLHELHETLDIRTIPACIGGDINKRHGVVVAKSTPAKAYGIVTGEPIVNAFKKCPTLVTFPPNFQLYRKYSEQFIEVLKAHSPCVEQFSIDEAWCDMTSCVTNRDDALALAETIRNEIKINLGFTINIGISTNKLLAKMAGDFQKPDKIHTLYPDEIQSKMWSLPVRDLFLVGKSTEKKLYNLGIRTIGELANSDPLIITNILKKHGKTIYEYANGIDNSKVNDTPSQNKGFGNSTTVAFDITDFETASLILKELSDTVSTRLKEHNARTSCISVTIRDTDFTDTSKQCTLADSTHASLQIHETACSLLKELWDMRTPLRLLGIYTSHITYNESLQYTIFDYDDGSIEKHNRLEDALKNIKKRYGDNAVTKASQINFNNTQK